MQQPDTDTSSVTPTTPSSITIPQPPEGRPTWQQLALRHFDPEAFRPRGRRVEHVANAYEDRVNNALFAESTRAHHVDICDFITNDVHVANIVILTDPELPNSPSVKEALAGPEHQKWHDAILDKLAAIKEAQTWTLVDRTPDIRNVLVVALCSRRNVVPMEKSLDSRRGW